ncbi:MAG: hypothetical protein A2840_02440 [Candidatus Buchananbacteria bacterium RIFCSPHIGHO2_01_FULL_47_11b]|uniref:Uncharacterized protein n=1 Tax=Candidatus Buchananbacteria bacterium RIFCSPHIGHO2_01_FULL_47_11b TaxID=1797537 RepID=A0A1G1Y6T3_9BACT|nr:MAG: hypothetical protein A2840_02440 [Candidatus Buchananbacteria bacterium RIFCSPHIGHO2_01_FULL_47_11b]
MSDNGSVQLQEGQVVVLPEGAQQFMRNSRHRREFPFTPKVLILQPTEDGGVKLLRGKNGGGFVLFVPEQLPADRKLRVDWSDHRCASTEPISDEVIVI